MRKVLLNPSQVSILASALVVVLFTSALFLSGYAIQQRTLRELREVIKPREVPRPFLSERSLKTILEDGTVMVLEIEERTRQDRLGEVRPSSEAEPETPSAKGLAETQPRAQVEAEEGGSTKATKRQTEMMEQIKAAAASKAWAVENPDPESKDRAPVSRAQRRRMIKDELQKIAAYGENPMIYQRRL